MSPIGPSEEERRMHRRLNRNQLDEFDDLDMDEDLLNDEEMDSMFSVDLGENNTPLDPLV